MAPGTPRLVQDLRDILGGLAAPLLRIDGLHVAAHRRPLGRVVLHGAQRRDGGLRGEEVSQGGHYCWGDEIQHRFETKRKPWFVGNFRGIIIPW